MLLFFANFIENLYNFCVLKLKKSDFLEKTYTSEVKQNVLIGFILSYSSVCFINWILVVEDFIPFLYNKFSYHKRTVFIDKCANEFIPKFYNVVLCYIFVKIVNELKNAKNEAL